MRSLPEQSASARTGWSALHGAFFFGLGALFEIASFIYPILLPRGFFMKHPWVGKYPGTTIISLAGPLLGGAVGGAWLGWVIRKRVLWTIEGALAFGVGFLPAALAMFVTLMAGQGMSGKENILGISLLYTLGFGIGFGISGLLAGALMFAGRRVVLASARAFATSGAAGGIAISTGFLLLRAVQNSHRDSHGKVLECAIFAGIILPYCLGGALLGAALPGLLKRGENGPN
jgi:hypothetical protein